MIILDVISWVLLGLGGFFVVVGGIGVLRMPDLYTRMHAVSVTETLGTILVLLGLMVMAGWSLASFKLFAILLFLLFTAPVSSYALANTAMLGGTKPLLDGEKQS
ncbi:monovalent cation/H(+) antiporter subunit G [Orrella daihaiensis]|uniref:Monovalent cation/H(+) antiporter subunit G n=1 Tax=Orrella daihaiensis TaxID=2782176 RepID=A0ABY4AJI7_9BURK|nr:monovalent cation/H(+) antiporter subunit G [Orrella daihaiensis]UOD50445.1 monovalent cation/H(+) antiporter subunit G [Orrella daihaiensis]